MPITVTGVGGGNGGDTANATSYATPANNNLADRGILLVAVWGTRASATVVPTCSGGALTYTQVASLVATSAYEYRLTLFRAVNLTGAAINNFAITASFGATVMTGCIITPMVFTGVQITGTNGADAIVQAVTATSAPAVLTHSVTLAEFGNPNNATVGVIGVPSNSTMTAGSGFTIASQGNYTTPAGTMGLEYSLSPDTTVDESWAVGPDIAVGIAVELRAASNLLSLM